MNVGFYKRERENDMRIHLIKTRETEKCVGSQCKPMIHQGVGVEESAERSRLESQVGSSL